MKTNIHGSGLLRRLPGLALALAFFLWAAQAYGNNPIMPAASPPGFFWGFSVGYDVNRYSDFDVDYPGLITLDDIATEGNNNIYYGLTFDYSLSDPEEWNWSLSTAVTIHNRSFSARADDVAVPLESDDCAGANSAQGAYNVDFDNLEVNLSAVVKHRLWLSRFDVGIGFGLGITGQSREAEQLRIEHEALLAGPACRIAATDILVPREVGDVADVKSASAGERILDPQMILTASYHLGVIDRYLLTTVATFNTSISAIGADEVQWQRMSLSIGLEVTTFVR